MQARRKHASYRHSIIRVRLQATRRGIRDLPTPVVDSELVNARVPVNAAEDAETDKTQTR